MASDALKSYLKRFLFLTFCLVFFFLVLEFTSRLFWTSKADVPFLSPVSYFYYPELRDVDEVNPLPGDGFFDILLLGGSVMNESRGNIAGQIREKATYLTGKRIRVHNLAMPGHTSLDSYYKYRHLAAKHFDLVIYYHGINDLRLNNCPPEIFRPDYSHYAWYSIINRFEKVSKTRYLTLPYSFTYLFVRAREQAEKHPGLPRSFIPRKNVPKTWLENGASLKTAGPFRKNLERIVEMAGKKGEPLLLLGFAFYVPADYTLERFEKHDLDYLLFDSPIEIWGTPRNVAAGILAHKKIVREVARKSPNVTYLDQDPLIPKERRYYNDICHLTFAGCERFAENIMKAVVKRINLIFLNLHQA